MRDTVRKARETARFPLGLFLLSAYLSVAAGPCSPTEVLLCPSGSYASGTKAGACLSYETSLSAGLPEEIGTSSPSFYYLGYDLGFILGNGTRFSRSAAGASETFIPQVDASFGGGPRLATGRITESFTSVAIYSEAQGDDYGLSGYVVAAGYALSSSGNVLGLIARFTPEGALDPYFGDGKGYVLTGASGFTGGSFTVIRSVAIDSQARIVVGGYGNALPAVASGYLNRLEGPFASEPDGDPHELRSVNANDELLGFVARYDFYGNLDTEFDAPSSLPAPNVRSAFNGFSLSPSGGYGALSSVGDRFDAILGVAVDEDDGIIAVGATASSYNTTAVEHALILHLDSEGTYLDHSTAEFTVGNREYFVGVLIDSSNRPVAVGYDRTGTLGLIARYEMDSDGVLSRDTSGFNSPSGFLRPATAGATEKFTSITRNSATGTLYVGGRRDGSDMLIRSFTSAGAVDATTSYVSLAGGARDSIKGLAVLRDSSGTRRVFGAGYARDGTATEYPHSLVGSWQTDLSAATDFGDNPFVNSPFSGAPTMYASAQAHIQLGVDNGAAETAYAGGGYEKFNAIAASPGGSTAVVVGYSSAAATGTSGLDGRVLPIVLFYSMDGTFPNLSLVDLSNGD